MDRGHTRSYGMTCSGGVDEALVLFRSDIEMSSAAAFRTKRGDRLANTVKYRQDGFYPERIIYLLSRTPDRSGKNRRTPEGTHLGTGAEDGRIRNLQGGSPAVSRRRAYPWRSYCFGGKNGINRCSLCNKLTINIVFCAICKKQERRKGRGKGRRRKKDGGVYCGRRRHCAHMMFGVRQRRAERGAHI